MSFIGGFSSYSHNSRVFFFFVFVFAESAAANKVSPKAGEPWLDPKYLPPEPPSGADRVSPYSITPGVVKAPGGSGGAVPGKLRPAALASSYFPKS